MKRKAYSSIIAICLTLIFSFLTQLSIPHQALAITDQCGSYGTYKDLPKLKFTVTKDGDSYIKVTLTNSQGDLDQWNNAMSETAIFQIIGFNGAVDPNNQLNLNPGIPKVQPSGTSTIFRIATLNNGSSLTPGQTYNLNFRLYEVPIPDGTLDGCALDDGPRSLSITASIPPSPGKDEPPPSDVECDPTGVGASDKIICPTSYTCEKQTSGKFACISSAQPPNAPLQSPCVNDDPQKGCDKIMTAFGPIDTTPNKLVTLVLGIVLSISGIILLLLLITNGYKLMTSQGDPEKIKDARDGIIAAISGLLLIVFSLVILEFITVGILGIPGFGK